MASLPKFDYSPDNLSNAFDIAGMDDFASDTDSDYTSYWRDWVSALSSFRTVSTLHAERKEAWEVPAVTDAVGA